ncbi:haloacid dehalogenase-like hydrolase [Trueperella pecoris]|uniref:Haloacid dehalogenase-like hydrolase n=1 Tax=Trueperella pecoris TaxID=2733571 RepID=A0A7M1R2N6_9ACTO|nr:haloacid dehalogenase-like hydrolase [Trueperella pecoris]QOR47747.1 haloacid dehalogenase-like hydrolase [Trueperella pecoris]
MFKRLLSANASEVLSMSAAELKLAIAASEGRTIVSENIVIREPVIPDLTNAEAARSVGADLILLNMVDVFDPKIGGLDDASDFVHTLHRLVGCPIGVNLEPVDEDARMLEARTHIGAGRTASADTLTRLEELGADFVCLTGNPATGVSNQTILASVATAKEHFSGLIIAGKMHGAGVNEPVTTPEVARALVDAGVDVVLVPAVGTVPGWTDGELIEVVKAAHEAGALVMSTIGTSQESSQEEVVTQIALRNKICGVDMQHIGDAGFGGVALVENILAMSMTIRGKRHAISRMARSVNR